MKRARDVADDRKAAEALVCDTSGRTAGLPVLVLLVLLMVFTIPAPAFGQASSGLQFKASVSMPNVAGRMDHLGVDLKGHRLFLTAFANHTVEVIDLRSGRRVRTLSNLGNPQGALYDPSANRLFVSSGMDGTVTIFDGTTFKVLATVKLSSDADNLRYDSRSNRIVVGYGGEKFLHGQPVRGHGDGALAFLDSAGHTTGEIPLDAHPESFQLERSGTRAFVNVPDHREIQVVDMGKHSVLGRWPVSACTDNFPMALDEAHHRLFVGCRTPSILLIFDTDNGKVIASFPMVEHSDDLFYDKDEGRIYVLGEGSIEIWQQNDANHYTRVGRTSTPADAHTGLFVPEWKSLFEAVPHHGRQDAELLMFSTP